MASRWPSWPQLGLKMAILAPTWGILAPSWLQLGPILAQFGEILADPSPAKIDQNLPGQLLKDFSPPGRPQELPDPLQTSIFQVFGSIFNTFSSIFAEHLFIDSALNFYLEGSRREGAAVLARRASSIISWHDMTSWYDTTIRYHDLMSWYHIMTWYYDIISLYYIDVINF